MSFRIGQWKCAVAKTFALYKLEPFQPLRRGGPFGGPVRNNSEDSIGHRVASAPDIAGDELMPLVLAAKVIEQKVYAYDPRSLPERTASIAHALAALIPLFVYTTDGANVRQLTDAELKGGLFRRGGEDLAFLDGRTPIANIAVQHKRMAEVIAMLQAGAAEWHADSEERPSSPQQRTA